MPYFLDGNNLIGHARATARPSDEDRQSLISEIAERLRNTRAKAVVFFDGPADKATSLGNLSIRGAGPQGADDAILREIGRSRTPREIVVVTADRELARRARDTGARTLPPDDFWSHFGVGQRLSPRDDAARVDVEDWLRYFQDEENRDR